MHVLAVEYPGYGIYKQGKATEEKLISDAFNVYDFMIKEMKFK
jgi:hypothetical protein